MKRYAFIDVQNTETTTRQLLGFLIDWRKLYLYLENKWKCEKVFFYTGIDDGDTNLIKEFEELSYLGCVVRSKIIYSYKRPDKTIMIKCIECGTENSRTVSMGYNRKSNCDVDLTVDAMGLASIDTEFLIFSGDGDFEYLIQKVIEKGTRTYIISSNAGLRTNNINTKRFSTKLKGVLKNNEGKIDLINIDSWKMKIRKTT
jgi:uncharacterized LabA/DUF88 family protein